MRLDLNAVTICAADSVTPQLAARAIDASMAQCNFGDAILFSDTTQYKGQFRNVKIYTLRSKQDYSRFILKDLLPFIHTPFVLVVQWDGYVADASAWQAAFTHFDYIGAVWPWFNDGMTVGNGGFSLRSRKLLEALQDARFPFREDIPEDRLICREYRPQLEKDYNIRFAPESVADSFSYENTERADSDAATFGFHGSYNLWRHVEDEEMCAIVELFSPAFFHTREFYALLARYALLERHAAAQALYRRLKHYSNAPEIYRAMDRIYNNDELTKYCLAVCENRAVGNDS